jgi:CheY-like chemotaxis protein
VSRGRILIAEDFLPAAFMVEEMARELGFDADVVTNGREAVARAQATRYVAVLMDVEMPVMDGIEATALIRKIERAAGFDPNPIIGMTGHTSQGVRVLCQRAGMDSFLLKPFTVADLEAALNKVMAG